MVDALERHDAQAAQASGFKHVANGKQRMLSAFNAAPGHGEPTGEVESLLSASGPRREE